MESDKVILVLEATLSKFLKLTWFHKSRFKMDSGVIRPVLSEG